MRPIHITKYALLFSGVLLLGAGCIRFTGTSGGDLGVFSSKNDGGAWEQKVFMRQGEKVAVTIGGEEITTLLFDPKNPSILYAGTEGSGIYKTENSGEVWTQFLPFKGRTDALAINPKNTATIFAALGERVFRTTDEGKNWSIAYLETRPKIAITDVAIDAFDPKKVYLALSNGDLMQSQDGGSSWAVLYHTESAVLRIIIHPKDTRVITLMTQYHGLYRTTNLGKDWQSLREPLQKYGGQAMRGQVLIIDPRNTSGLLYFSNFGLLQSKDGGKSWEEKKLLTTSDITPVTAAAIAPTHPDTIYYATAMAFYRSHDSGKTWTTALLPTTRRPSIILAHPKESGVIYLGAVKQKK